MAESRLPTDTLPSVAVSRAMLATAQGRRKLDLVLSSPNPKAFLRRLPAEDVYFAIREIGLADAGDLVGLAAPEQFRAFVDLDTWEKDQPLPLRVLEWLQLAFESTPNRKDFRARRDALDRELLLLVLKANTRVHQLEEGVDPELETNNYVRTAEGKYLVEILTEGDEQVFVRRLIEDFIEENPFEATRLFEATKWELGAELEESTLRWRTGRMRDMGFPDIEEALRLWNPLPASWTPHEAPPASGPVAGVPALLLATSPRASLLDRVAERLADEDRTHFNEGLVYLLNCALVADGIDPKDLDLARGSLAAARDMLSLGLELASDGNEERALAILATTPATELFRFAVTRVQELARTTVSAARPVTIGSGATILDMPESGLVAGLRRRRPRFYDPPKPGETPAPGGDWRAFRSGADLDHVHAALDRVRVMGAVLQALGATGRLDAVADAANRAATAITVGQLAMTAAAHHLLGEPPSVDPLQPAQAAGLCAFFEGGKLVADARTKLVAHFASLASTVPAEQHAALGAMVTRWLDTMEAEIGAPCAAGGLDPRFVDAVLFAPA